MSGKLVSRVKFYTFNTMLQFSTLKKYNLRIKLVYHAHTTNLKYK